MPSGKNGGVANFGKMTMSGGLIYSNGVQSKTRDYDVCGGGGITAKGTLNIQCIPEIRDNAEHNVYVDVTANVTVDLRDREKPGSGEVINVLTGFAGDSSRFTCTDDAYALGFTDDGRVQMTGFDPIYPDFFLTESLQEIEESAFESIAAKAVLVNDNCTTISKYAFRNCPNLQQVFVPADCELGTDVFAGCRTVLIFGTSDSKAATYCVSHDNCVFVAVDQE